MGSLGLRRTCDQSKQQKPNETPRNHALSRLQISSPSSSLYVTLRLAFDRADDYFSSQSTILLALRSDTHCRAIRGGRHTSLGHPSLCCATVGPTLENVEPFSPPRRTSISLPYAFTQCTDTGRDSTEANAIWDWNTSS